MTLRCGVSFLKCGKSNIHGRPLGDHAEKLAYAWSKRMTEVVNFIPLRYCNYKLSRMCLHSST